MHLDATVLTTFRSRFEAKEPDPKNFVRRVTKLDVYLTVEDLVEARRSNGFAWEGIAEDFTALGVRMSVATLKTCFRRARSMKRSGTPARPKPPSRRSSRSLRAEREVQRSDRGALEETRPTGAAGSFAVIDAVHAATEIPGSKEEEASNVAANARAKSPDVSADTASHSADAVAADAPPTPAAAADTDSNVEIGPTPRSEATPLDAPSPTLATLPHSPSVDLNRANGDIREEASRNWARVSVHAGQPRTPPPAPPNRPESSRLSELRARASPPDKGRMAFAPRDDKEL